MRAQTSSTRLTMRDGVRIAIDVHLPRGASVPERVPAIMRQTRYLRSLAARGPLAAFGLASQFDLYRSMRREFLQSGYAWIDVDVRGTGASTGVWRSPWFDDEIEDGREIADFIVRQPWSNGRIGSLGISYDGTCAEMLLANRHPAVRAVAPMFSLYDVYTDIAFPGGIHLAWFTEHWARYNAALDRNAFGEAMAIPLRLMARVAATSPAPTPAERLLAAFGKLDEAAFDRVARRFVDATVRGVRPVDSSGREALTPADLAARADNLDVHAGALKVAFRDDAGVHPDYPERTIDSFSPHRLAPEIAASGAAIYSYSGWRDGAYPSAAVKRFRAVPNAGSRLTLGPWAHTGRLRVHAFELGAPTRFDHIAELLDFFDEHLTDAGSLRGDGRPVHYFTTGTERWRAASAWPPPGGAARVLHLAAGRRLADDAPRPGARDADGADERAIDPRVGTGERSRWRSLLAIVPGDYPDRRARDEALLVYEGIPLGDELEIAGSPELTLFVAWTEPDAAQIFAYLEDVAPDGRVSYVTEGQLRAIHRRGGNFLRREAAPVGAGEVLEMTFELLPVAHAWKRGHRIRLALAGADADHFARAPGGGTFRVHHGPTHPSRLTLPAHG